MIPQVFRDVDILASLAGIMDQHTKYYKDDFDLDKSIIHTLSRSSDENDRRLIWLCRPLGTHCLRERDVFLEGTHENSVFRFYHEQTKGVCDPSERYGRINRQRRYLYAGLCKGS